MHTPRLFLAYSGQVGITINVSTRQLTLEVRHQVHGMYPVAVGKPATPTPVGDWRIAVKTVNPSWQVLGTRWMGLNIPWGNYGIHGTNAPWSIGRYISNGCIRMHNHHAEEVFAIAPVGTPVSIIGSYHSVYSGGLTQGARGPEVTQLQIRLRDNAFDPGPIDGIFGPKTLAALIAFQRNRGLRADGTLNPETRAALGL